jgi:hypothetical protein
MSDINHANNGSNSQRTLSKVLGIKAKGPQLPHPSEDEVLDAVIARALTDTHQIKQQNKELSRQIGDLTHELQSTKMDLEAEIRTQKTEYDGKLNMARSENEFLRKQLDETGAKMEYYQRWSLELVTKANDLEIFYIGEMQKLHEASDLCQRGMMSAVNATARSMKAFLDDLHNKAKAGEYRPNGAPKKDPIKLSDDDEERLRAMMPHLTARIGEQSEEDTAN